MKREAIRFGTDGWRAVVARDFTFANLTRVARATASWLHGIAANPTVVIGHDARFMGDRFAQHVAEAMARDGVRVTLAEGITPTPAISWATKAYGADAGVVITASHNPAHYNGFKIKASFGGPATPAITAAVERALPMVEAKALADKPGAILAANVHSDYAGYLREKFDMAALRRSGLKMAHDAMYGAGQGFFSMFLGKENVVELHNTQNPSFGGLAPEPIGRNLGPFMSLVARSQVAIGIANDGDADRIGVVNELGHEVTSHLVMALLVKYLYQECGMRGSVVRTFATSAILEKMGRAYGLPVETLPIGFKYVAPRIVESDVLLGGEESGGIALKGHICERDGIYVGLVLLEMLLRREKPLSGLVQELFDEFGPHEYYRSDVRTNEQQAIIARLRAEGGLKYIAGSPVVSLDGLDGFKHITKEGWLLVRPSGTEPVLRIYAEAPSKARAKEYVADVAEQFGLKV